MKSKDSIPTKKPVQRHKLGGAGAPFFQARDFHVPLCVGPMKGAAGRVASTANAILAKTEARQGRKVYRSIDPAVELFKIKATLSALAHLIENQNTDGSVPSGMEYWGMALLIKNLGFKVGRIQRRLELCDKP